MRGISFLVAPIPDHAFFKHTVFQSVIGNQFLHVTHFVAKVFHLTGACSAFSIPIQPAFASLKEFLRPTVIQALSDALAAAKLSDTVFAAQAFEYDSDLLFCRVMFARGPPDVFDNLLGRSVVLICMFNSSSPF